VANVGNFHPTPRVITNPAFAEHPLGTPWIRWSWELDPCVFVDLEFPELGVWLEKIGAELFFKDPKLFRILPNTPLV
jgi:hypothetical protein